MIVLIITTGHQSCQLDFAKFHNACAYWEVDAKLGHLSARIRTYDWLYGSLLPVDIMILKVHLSNQCHVLLVINQTQYSRAFSGHCEKLRSLVDSSNTRPALANSHDSTRLLLGWEDSVTQRMSSERPETIHDPQSRGLDTLYLNPYPWAEEELNSASPF